MYRRSCAASVPQRDAGFHTDMIVGAVSTFIRAHPFAQSTGGGNTPRALVGLRIGAEWNSEPRKRQPSCHTRTHLEEILGPVTTAACQPMVGMRLSSLTQRGDKRKPLEIDGCHAHGALRFLAKSMWPDVGEGRQEHGIHWCRCRRP
nr:DUF2889 domain-containing protein [Burkholderia diffusa]